MTHTLAYTPYDGSSEPFTIGLLQLDPDRWIEPDEHLDAQLTEKKRLLARHGEGVFRAEAGTELAQQETLEALAEYLPARYPSIYRRRGALIELPGHRVNLADQAPAPLQRAGLLVQDDLVIMRRGADGWRIAAAFPAFPSSWLLGDKFGKSLDEVHAPVPGFAADSRNAELINRMFDNLSPARFVVRWNWSINWRHALYHPAPSSAGELASVAADDAVIRIERQTLRKMPLSGDILFTIRIYLDPVKAIMAQPNALALSAGLADQLETLTADQARYKGLVDKRSELIEMLRAGGEAATSP